MGDQPDLPGNFLHLHNAQICFGNRRKNIASENCLIDKSSVLFVGEDKEPPFQNTRIYRNESGPFTPKKAIGVEIVLPSFFITGQMYIELWQRLIEALNDDRRFIPMTNVLVSRQNDRIAEFEFVAVNRNQINCIAQTGNTRC
jgi:hypothetical protein